MLRGLGPAAPDRETRKDSTEKGGGEGSQEDRMNELAAEKRKRRLKEVRPEFDRQNRNRIFGLGNNRIVAQYTNASYRVRFVKFLLPGLHS